MNMLDALPMLPPEQQQFVLANVDSADAEVNVDGADAEVNVDGADAEVIQSHGQVCKLCGGLKAGPSGSKEGCTCCSCKGCSACSKKGMKSYLPKGCGENRIGRQSAKKIITKCKHCNKLVQKKSYNQQRSNNLQRLTDMESKSAAVAVKVCAEADSANIDSAQQRPAATLGDTTQLAVQLAAQLISTARASSLPATSVQPQCDGSITEVLQPPAAGSCPVAGGSEGDCADIDSAPLATTPSAITCVDIAHHHPTATLGDTTKLTAQPFATARASSLPSTSVQPQCDGSSAEVLQLLAAGSGPVSAGSAGPQRGTKRTHDGVVGKQLACGKYGSDGAETCTQTANAALVPVAAGFAAPLAPPATFMQQRPATTLADTTQLGTSVTPREVASAYARVSKCIESEEFMPSDVATLHWIVNQIEQNIMPAIMGGMHRECKNKSSFLGSIRKQPRVASKYNIDPRELPICAAASIVEQGYCIVPNPPGHIANIRNAFERAASQKQRCTHFSPIGQLYPGLEFGNKPNIGDGKRESTDSTAACSWVNALHIMLHFIIAYYELGTQVLELEGDELPQFMESSMLRSLMGVKVQGGHFDTEVACDTFMQHGPCGRPDGIVVISPIDGPSNVLILKNWAGSKVPTAEEFADSARPIDIPADHTLLMSDHMPHAGGDMPGRRAHAIFARPDCVSRKLEKQTYWLKPECVPKGK